MMIRYRFIHVTDTHLVPRGQMLHGLDPQARLRACVSDIRAVQSEAELCVITGDLAHRGEKAAYEVLREELRALPMPARLLMGNHDRREPFRTIFPQEPQDESGFLQSAHETPAGVFLFLDTLEEGAHWGRYCERRRRWLEDRLRAAGDRPVFLFMHHPPFDIGIPCLDRIGLRDADGLAELLATRPIRHLFFGHVHRPVMGSWRGIPFSTLRGTNHQVPFDLSEREDVPKSHEQPAYGVVFLDREQTTVHIHDYLDKSVWPASG